MNEDIILMKIVLFYFNDQDRKCITCIVVELVVRNPSKIEQGKKLHLNTVFLTNPMSVKVILTTDFSIAMPQLSYTNIIDIYHSVVNLYKKYSSW